MHERPAFYKEVKSLLRKDLLILYSPHHGTTNMQFLSKPVTGLVLAMVVSTTLAGNCLSCGANGEDCDTHDVLLYREEGCDDEGFSCTDKKCGSCQTFPPCLGL